MGGKRRGGGSGLERRGRGVGVRGNAGGVGVGARSGQWRLVMAMGYGEGPGKFHQVEVPRTSHTLMLILSNRGILFPGYEIFEKLFTKSHGRYDTNH